MPVALAYVVVVAIWSTTPLMIQLSSAEIGFVNAVAWRMVLAAWIAIAVFMSRPKWLSALLQWRVHGAGAIGIGIGLSLVYFSAQYLPSGLISVVFALSPILAGGLGAFFGVEKPPNIGQQMALVLALVGITFVFISSFNNHALVGFALLTLLISVLMFNVSGVLVKKYQTDMHPVAQTLGTLVYVMPIYLIIGLVFGAPVPDHLSAVSLGSLLYLSLGGSLLGFIMYFYLVKRLTIASVGTVTLITPVIALMLGRFIQHEVLEAQQWLGVGLIFLGLVGYQQLRTTRPSVVANDTA